MSGAGQRVAKLEIEQIGQSTGEPSAAMRALVAAVRRAADRDSELSPEKLRKTDVLESFGLPRAAGVGITTLMACVASGRDVPLRVYRPARASEALPVVVFAHGGCFVFGTPAMYDGLCSQLAMRARCCVVSVDYRRAPEHAFPAALEDMYEAVCWLRQSGARLGLDAQRLALAGDSAGGNLAAATSLVLRARGAAPALLQVLIYPITNLASLATPSYVAFADGFLSRELMSWARDQYLTSPALREDPWVSPLLEPDFSGLPRALVLSAELDVLRDESEAFAARLFDAKIAVRALRYAGVEHAFMSMAGALEQGAHALATMATELTEVWGERPSSPA